EHMRLDNCGGAPEKKVAAKEKAVGPPVEPDIQEIDGSEIVATQVNDEAIKQITRQISVVPDGVNLNPKMVTQVARRAKMGEGSLPMDWAFAEAIAFGSLALEGTQV